MKPFLRTVMMPVILFILTIGLNACDSNSETSSNQNLPTIIDNTNAAELITVTKPWIRATAPGQTISGAFMTLVNNSEIAYALTSVSFSDASTVEIHETSMNDGMMRMRKLNQVTIPANGIAELKPGSFHIMLIGLEKDMVAGETETLTLTFSDDSQKTVEALVGTLSE